MSEEMSYSQFKSFCDCPACAMAKIRGEWNPPQTEALLVGSYIDQGFTGTEESRAQWLEENGDKVFKKDGKPYAYISKADAAIEAVKRQPLMLHYLDGEHQREFHGTIAGVPFHGFVDVYRKGEFIADLKYVKDLRSPNMFESLVHYYKYDAQGAIYRELIRQETGETLPYYLVIVTKETIPRVAVANISDEDLNQALGEVERRAPYFQKIKNGEEPAQRCEQCDWCASTTMLEAPIDSNLLGMGGLIK